MMAFGHGNLPAIGTLVLLCAASVLTQLITNPYITCHGQYNRLFQDASDCSSYIVCNNDRLTRASCPVGQVFSPVHNSCGNYQTPSGCQNFGLFQTQGDAHPTPTYKCPDSHGKFQDTNDCSGYYVCTNYQSHWYQCPNGQMFDPNNEVCSNIHNPVGCHAPGAGAVTSRGTGSCNQNNAISQDVNDCSKYFVCTNYILQSRTCPSGQLFDPSRSSCGYTQNPAGCTMPVYQRQGTFRCNQANGQVQDTADCSRYYLCTNWDAQSLACPIGQLFDPNMGMCGSIVNPGHCNMPENWLPVVGGTTWGSQTLTSFQCRQSSGQFQDTADCSRYYMCTNWTPQRLMCPSGQLFNPTTGVCGSITNPGHCQMPVTWTGGSTWSGQSSNSYNCPEGNGEFPYAPDCSKFLRCDNYRGTLMSCPGSLLFNPNRGYCDWSEQYSTHNSCTLPARMTGGNQILNAVGYYK
ncbi:hypothetical protein EGW08_012605 [Elysia chlorotica]|uniref:Chitin-binding type-2 domain-containing protein n=1 Tax=Elysia chlorotica TaxID=188477 RepID=A0A433TDL2_ELYCH|nr:hypothetical protein EGW08_012605 [Elysia chlorotica]